MIAFLSMAMAVALGDPPVVDVATIDHGKHHGVLERLDAASLSLRTADGATKLPLAQVAQITLKGKSPSESQPTSWIECIDGTRMPAASFQLREGKAHWELLDGSSITTSARAVRAVRFYRPAAATDRAWRDYVSQRRPTDLIVIRKTSESLDMLEGMVRAVTDESVEFEFDGQKIPVKRTKLEGIVLSAARAAERPLECMATDQHGGEWHVAELTIENGRVVLTTQSGVKWRGDPSFFSRFDFSSLGTVSLADLAPLQEDWHYIFPLPTDREDLIGLLKQRYAPRKGTCPATNGHSSGTGGPSLVLTSGTEVTYRLPEPFESLRAQAVIAPSAGRSGHVRLVISSDGKPLFSEAITAGDPPTAVEVPLQGVRRLTIRVEFGRNLHLGDELHLCHAVLVKPSSKGNRTDRNKPASTGEKP